MKETNTVLLALCDGLLATDRKEQLESIRRIHQIEREEVSCHEYQLCLKLWPGRGKLDTMDPLKTTLDSFWTARAGLPFDVCGCTKSKSAIF